MITTIAAILFLSAPVSIDIPVEAKFREEYAIIVAYNHVEPVELISRAEKSTSTVTIFSGFPSKVEYKPGCVPCGLAAMDY